MQIVYIVCLYYMFVLYIILKINPQSFKRTLNRRVEKAIAKRTCLDNLVSVVNNQFNESDSDQSDSSSDYQGNY